MTNVEMIFTMLGEAATTKIAKTKDTNGMSENKVAAREGGSVAGNARRQLESKSGRKIVTREDYLVDKPKPNLPPPSKGK